MCLASAGPGRPSATTSPLRASAACMSLDSRGSFSAALACSWPTTSQAGCPSASLTSCTGAADAHLREQRERVVPVVVTPRVERRMARACHSLFSISRKPEHSRSITARRPSTTLQTAVWVQTQRVAPWPQVEAVVDQQPVGDRLARRLHDLDGVEVGEPAAEAGDDVLAAVRLDRATGQQGTQPDGLGQRRGQPLRVALARRPRRAVRRRDGVACATPQLARPAGGRPCPGTRPGGRSARARPPRRRRSGSTCGGAGTAGRSRTGRGRR